MILAGWLAAGWFAVDDDFNAKFWILNEKCLMIKKLTNNHFYCWNYSKHCSTKPEVSQGLLLNKAITAFLLYKVRN